MRFRQGIQSRKSDQNHAINDHGISLGFLQVPAPAALPAITIIRRKFAGFKRIEGRISTRRGRSIAAI
jgi:hypothetical protein